MTYIEWLEDKCLHILDESWVCDLMSEHADEWEYCSEHCENGKGECLRRLYTVERKTGPNCSGKPNNCETCKHWWKSEEVCLLDECQYEPKTEPQTEPTTDCRHSKMSLDDAYYLVYKDLTKEDGLLTGKYDAKNGSKQYMNGVWSVMELIAYGVGIDCYEAFNERFCRNLEKSQEQTEREGE